MRFGIWLLLVGTTLILSACSASKDKNDNVPPAVNLPPDTDLKTGINPQINVGEIDRVDKAALSMLINEAVALFKSPAFETNFKRASLRFPDVYISAKDDIIPSPLLLKRLKTQDPQNAALWWPKAYVGLDGEIPMRSDDPLGFGFIGSRKAIAGPHPKETPPQTTGQIVIGRLHLARYTQGNIVEKSCALNTMVHEISHTLSETSGIYWMHILDSQRGITPPRGVPEASYFIGVVAQCTYLENMGRTRPAEFEACLLTFSDPSLSSRFRSSACDDFPEGKPISPQGWLHP